MPGTNRCGEGAQEPAMWPRLWVTTRRRREKKGEENKWDGKKYYEEYIVGKYIGIAEAKVTIQNDITASPQRSRLGGWDFMVYFVKCP